MKLLNHTTKYFALLLVVLISVWAVIFYFAMLDEVYDSLDDGLENQKELIEEAAKKDKTLLIDTDFGINNFTIKKLPNKIMGKTKDSYRDTLMYMQNEGEYEAVRILESVFEQDGESYNIKLITSMVEEDDQIQNLARYLLFLYLALVASILLLNNLILKKVWKPFYELIGRLKSFRIEKDEALRAQPTNIDEFRLLNQNVEKLTEKARASYVAQKEFIQNASHELQTPLAIAINKLELLLEKNELTESQSNEVGTVLENLDRLTRLNKSLLLLSKIENQQYAEEEPINFNALVEKTATDFQDFAEHKNIALQIDAKGTLEFAMNKDLAAILLVNLIKNAIVHGVLGKSVIINIDQNKIEISNFGTTKGLPQDQLFKRFRNNAADSRSTGLGLAISKAIADRYGLTLRYNFTDRHIFELSFPTI